MEHEEATPRTAHCGKRRYRFLIPLFILLAIAVFSTAVMLLWNAVIPGITGWAPLTWPKALGLLVLCKILFGGFRGGRGGHRHGPWRRRPKGGPDGDEMSGEDWREKLRSVSEEKREKLREEWRKRCGGDRFRGRSRRWIEVFTEPGRLEHHADVHALHAFLVEARVRRRGACRHDHAVSDAVARCRAHAAGCRDAAARARARMVLRAVAAKRGR